MKKTTLILNLALFFAFVFLTLGCVKTKTPLEEESGAEQAKQKQEAKEPSQLPQDWLKFENQSHKLKLYYPPQWTLKPEIEKETLLTFFLELEDKTQEQKTFWDGTTGYPYYSLAFRIENNPDNLSALDWAVKQVISQAREEAKLRYKMVNLGQYQATYDTGPVSPAGIYHQYIICPGNDKAYSFIYRADAYEQSQDKYLDQFKQILENLEFLN